MGDSVCFSIAACGVAFFPLRRKRQDGNATCYYDSRNPSRGEAAMNRRSRAREVALQLLFQHDHNPGVARATVERFVHDRLRDDPAERFCLQLYDGCLTHGADIDQRLSAAAENWRLVRMATV